MTLTFGSQTLGVGIDSESATLSRGFGVYPLSLSLRLNPMNFDRGTVVELSGELEVHGNPSHWLAASTHSVRVPLHGTQTSCSIKFPLTSAQILGIEEHRAGCRAGFGLKLRGFLPGDPTETGQESSEYFAIAASTWLDLVEQVDAGVAFTIPIPIIIGTGARAEGAELLREARGHLNAGNIDAAIVSARGAMERAEAAAQWPRIAKDDDLRTRSQAQRWRAIYRAAFDQAAGAVHEDEVTKEFAYSRREAEALIGIAAALLKAAPDPIV